MNDRSGFRYDIGFSCEGPFLSTPQFPSLPPSCLIASSWHVTQSRRDTRGFYPFSLRHRPSSPRVWSRGGVPSPAPNVRRWGHMSRHMLVFTPCQLRLPLLIFRAASSRMLRVALPPSFVLHRAVINPHVVSRWRLPHSHERVCHKASY